MLLQSERRRLLPVLLSQDKLIASKSVMLNTSLLVSHPVMVVSLPLQAFTRGFGQRAPNRCHGINESTELELSRQWRRDDFDTQQIRTSMQQGLILLLFQKPSVMKIEQNKEYLSYLFPIRRSFARLVEAEACRYFGPIILVFVCWNALFIFYLLG